VPGLPHSVSWLTALRSAQEITPIHGVSTRAVDNLAEALGIKSISKDQVSRISTASSHTSS